MQTAPIPTNETERLESLRRLKILDSPPEERFDRITKLATKFFNVPISTITLVDANREWFKSVCGLPNKEGDRAISFCGHAMLADDMLIIKDAREDERFKDNPMVVGEPYIRFYAGVPIFSADGQRIGTFCIKDHKPRDFSDEDKEAIRAFTAWSEVEINSHNIAIAIDRIKQSVIELDTFFSTSQDIMCIATKDGFFRRINPAFERILGYDVPTVLRTPFIEFVHPEDVFSTQLEIKKLSEGFRVVNFVDRFKRKDGEYIYLQWNATAQNDDFYAIARDITLSKQREHDLEVLNNSMIDREIKMIELKNKLKELEAKLL